MNYEFFHSLKNTKVKDLYWLLFKPCPIKHSPEGFSIDFFPEELIEEWETRSVQYFKELDSAPGDLERFVDRKKNYRLGFYAESLLSFFFQTFKEVKLILQNYQIREEKKTIGEIDFIIEYKGTPYHLELAVKYYLLRPEHNSEVAENWIGPSRKDNLHKKLTKVQDHQLPLGNHKEVMKHLSNDYEGKIKSYFLFRGQFFVNDQIDCGLVNTSPLPYFFKRELSQDKILQVLKRPDWLSSIDRNLPDLSEKIELNDLNRPQMVKLKEKIIGFIVPDDWED